MLILINIPPHGSVIVAEDIASDIFSTSQPMVMRLSDAYCKTIS